MNAFAELQQILSKSSLESSAKAALLLFTLGDQRHALPLSHIDRVVLAVAVTPLAGAPDPVLGVINLQGQIIPVISGRKWLGLPERPVQLNDRLIIALVAERKVAVLVDHVQGVVTHSSSDEVQSGDLLPGLSGPASVIKGDGGLILMHPLQDLELLTRRMEASKTSKDEH